MIVRRTIEYVVKKFKTEDQIYVGKYTATAVKRVDDNTMLFCLDQYLDRPFTHEDLLDKLNEYLQNDPNFEDIMPKVAEIDGVKFRIPYVGEMFGKDSFYKSDKDDGTWYDQWFFMMDRRNRIADRDGVECELGWLMNQFDEEYYKCFSGVDAIGKASGYSILAELGIRPIFALRESA